jgi:hypothetical protein
MSCRWSIEMAKYGRKAQEKVGAAMHEFKEGRLKSGASGRKVKNPKQAIAIGLAEARRAGGKVPPEKPHARGKVDKKKPARKK